MEAIDLIYENMKISRSIVVCDSTDEMSFLLEKLEAKSYPCLYASACTSETFQQSPHQMFMSLPKEFNSRAFRNLFEDVNIDCIIFVGFETFVKCVEAATHNFKNSASKQFIFTI